MVHKRHQNHENHENQLDIFTEQPEAPQDSNPQPLESTGLHDYGGILSDDQNEAGHEFPFTRSLSEIEKDSHTQDSPMEDQPKYPFPSLSPEQQITINAPRVAISLQGRAQALMDILDFYAKNGREKGVSAQRKIPESGFNTQYKSGGAADVKYNVENKRGEALPRFHEGVAYLAQQQALIDAGLTEGTKMTSVWETSLQSSLNKEFNGKAPKYGARRSKLAKKLLEQSRVMGFPLTTTEDRRPVNRKRKQ